MQGVQASGGKHLSTGMNQLINRCPAAVRWRERPGGRTGCTSAAVLVTHKTLRVGFPPSCLTVLTCASEIASRKLPAPEPVSPALLSREPKEDGACRGEVAVACSRKQSGSGPRTYFASWAMGQVNGFAVEGEDTGGQVMAPRTSARGLPVYEIEKPERTGGETPGVRLAVLRLQYL